MRYYVFTWDMDAEEFTPQEGVPCGPHNLYALRLALQELRRCGYSCHRVRDAHGNYDINDASVLVCSEENLSQFHINMIRQYSE